MNHSLDLAQKSHWVRKETLRLCRRAASVRAASSLSTVELFVVLYYGGVLDFQASNPDWQGRDRFIISKGHGAVSLYPVLADLGFFGLQELEKISTPDSFLGVIPDAIVPGFETTNGALGHGPGLACGVALALRAKKQAQHVFVLTGDGEMHEGSVWEAAMLAAHHRLDNLLWIIDNNGKTMLGPQEESLGLVPFEEKFAAFHWQTARIDGHDLTQLQTTLQTLKATRQNKPKVLILDTVKGKGVPELENDPMCHVTSFRPEEIDRILKEIG